MQGLRPRVNRAMTTPVAEASARAVPVSPRIVSKSSSTTSLGVSTLTGSRYAELNQDAICHGCVHNSSLPAHHKIDIAVVLDGHGMLGELCAQAAGEVILSHLKTQLTGRHLDDMLSCDVQRICEEAFLAGHQEALDLYEKAPQRYTYPLGSPQAQEFSLIQKGDTTHYHHPLLGSRLLEFGCTATAVVVQGSKAVIAHVGDSLAVLGREGGGMNSPRGQVVTRRHFAGDPEEIVRLNSTVGDRIAVIGKEQYLAVCDGVRPSLSLAMTRALGHKLMSDYGVVPLPDVSIIDLDPDDHICLIAASDGVWESMSASTAVRCVRETLAQGRSVDDAAYVLCHESVKQIRYADNTSAAVFVFERSQDLDE